jgi:hypothetical protein
MGEWLKPFIVGAVIVLLLFGAVFGLYYLRFGPTRPERLGPLAGPLDTETGAKAARWGLPPDANPFHHDDERSLSFLIGYMTELEQHGGRRGMGSPAGSPVGQPMFGAPASEGKK